MVDHKVLHKIIERELARARWLDKLKKDPEAWRAYRARCRRWRHKKEAEHRHDDGPI